MLTHSLLDKNKPLYSQVMRRDHRPYWLKKLVQKFSNWYSANYLLPACDHFGSHFTIMKPWCVQISGPNIHIGQCITLIGEPDNRVRICVWGRKPDSGTIEIGDYVLISPGVRISALDQITIGSNVMIANGVYITDSDWHTVYNRTKLATEPTPVTIADNVWLGDGSRVLKGVTIGENSVVAAGAVVSKDVPANVVVAGNPAKVVKTLDPEQVIVTRERFFTDPAGQEKLYDGLDQLTLADNSLLGWLKTIIRPTRQD